jgi:hypothetical protein
MKTCFTVLSSVNEGIVAVEYLMVTREPSFSVNIYNSFAIEHLGVPGYRLTGECTHSSMQFSTQQKITCTN